MLTAICNCCKTQEHETLTFCIYVTFCVSCSASVEAVPVTQQVSKYIFSICFTVIEYVFVKLHHILLHALYRVILLQGQSLPKVVTVINEVYFWSMALLYLCCKLRQ